MRAPRALSSVCLTASLTLLAVIAAADTTANPETLAERSQATARAVLDRAVAAIGGAEALRSIEFVRLRLEGENWPRLQMPTAGRRRSKPAPSRKRCCST